MNERTIDDLDGMYVALLSDDELDLFEQAVRVGRAYRQYQGAGGLMGVAKVAVRKPVTTHDHAVGE